MLVVVFGFLLLFLFVWGIFGGGEVVFVVAAGFLGLFFVAYLFVCFVVVVFVSLNPCTMFSSNTKRQDVEYYCCYNYINCIRSNK